MKKKNIVTLMIVVSILGILAFLTIQKDKKYQKNEEQNEPTIKMDFKHFNNDEFAIKIPETFELMDETILKIKYPAERRPQIVYTNEDNSINVAVSILEDEVESIKEYLELTKKYLNMLEIKAESEYYEKNNHGIGELKLISKALNAEIYNNMMFFEVNGKLRIISFNCTIEQQDEWKKIGDYIIDSLVIYK
jgi:hypothetical protein